MRSISMSADMIAALIDSTGKEVAYFFMDIRGCWVVITGWSIYKSQWCGEPLKRNANDINNAVVPSVTGKVLMSKHCTSNGDFV